MSTTCLEPQPLLEALIAGLGVAAQGLGAKCEAALRAVGGRALPYVIAAAESAPWRRSQLEAFAAKIDGDQDYLPETAWLCRDALLTAAAVLPTEENPNLIVALQAVGDTVVDKLVREAIAHRKKPAICLRTLKMIERLGGVRGGDVQFEVAILLVSKNSAVRELALKLFCLPQAKSRADEARVSA